MFSSSPAEEKTPDPLYEQAKRAVAFANRTCFIGASNKRRDLEKTQGYSDYLIIRHEGKGSFHKRSGKDSFLHRLFGLPPKKPPGKLADHWHFDPVTQRTQKLHTQWQYFHDNEATFFINNHSQQNPLEDPQFPLKPEHVKLFGACLLGMRIHGGNCEIRSCLVIKYLWEHGHPVQRLELVSAGTFDHVFVLINRKGNALQDPSTWGDAWIADPWAYDDGIVYHARDFQQEIQKIKAHVQDDLMALKQVGVISNATIQPGEETLSVKLEIDLARDRYPTYQLQPLKPVEDYYDIDLLYGSMSASQLENDRREHKNRFQAVLKDIRHTPDDQTGQPQNQCLIQ